jgi:hypothetical protein
MKRWLALLIGTSASLAVADDANPYFHAIHCKAEWSELTPGERSRVPGSGEAIAAIDKVLAGYVSSGEKTSKAIEADIADFKAYSNFEAHHLKDWKTCVDFYAHGTHE